MGGYHLIAEEASRLAKLLPPSVVEAVAARLERGDGSDRGSLRSQIAQAVPSPHHRSLVVAFLDRWGSEAGGVLPQSVAAALLTGSLAEKGHREGQSVELVWTGPDVGVVPFRRTEQAVLQVIDSAGWRLLVVSYAVYNIPRICEALVRAAARGVVLTVVVEAAEKSAGREAYNTLRALGPAVASHSSVYLWPHEHRPRDENGRAGLLHVKCVAGDGRWLFVSSANLTEYAFTTNMELGVLITGGEQPAQVQAHFERLVETGVLVKA
ncbi:DISARM system phospholipase D-like protein DrmC [Singulisphaera sp. Ch08]|uniref:phospholipase D n=1 Tax=Singulisphaera sp. Ch08 TaxID=3120278 RepID=A0AAU7CNE4_9BACT